MCSICRDYFAWSGGVGPKPILPFLIYQPTASNQKQTLKNLCCFTLLKVCIDRIKIIKDHYLNINRSHFTGILSKP